MKTYEKLLSVKEVAKFLGIAEKTVRKYIWERTIPYYKINGHIRFSKEDLDTWISERQVQTLEEILSGNKTKHII
jgi:excisionase family DNA binding protein